MAKDSPAIKLSFNNQQELDNLLLPAIELAKNKALSKEFLSRFADAVQKPSSQHTRPEAPVTTQATTTLSEEQKKS